VQGYFSLADKDVEIRVRRKGSQYFITVKGGRGRRRLEEEIEISKSNFRSLWPLVASAHISKRRYKIPCNGHTVEMDVYEGPHGGLITADIEFNSVRESRSFKAAAWLGREITGVRRFANEVLARHQRLPLNWKRGG
jgi:CYTH domain-containing protein